MRKAFLLAFVLTLVLPCAKAAEAQPVDRSKVRDGWGNLWIQNPVNRTAAIGALNAASKMLEDSTCSAVVSEFNDLQGRPLSEKLESLSTAMKVSVNMKQYMSLIIWRDGSDFAACKSSKVVAVTEPGSRVVYLCVANVRDQWHYDPLGTSANMIHEGLHSLGLGENPPTAREITARVMSKCRDALTTTSR